MGGPLDNPGSGAAPHQRRSPLAEGALRATVRPHDLVVALGPDRVVRIDAEGRWCTWRLGSRTWRRTVDGRVCIREGIRVHDLAQSDADGVHDQVRDVAAESILALEAKRGPISIEGSPAELLRRLGIVRHWTSERLAGERARFRRTYPEAVTILPPDRYRDVVVLPATGCPWGRCTFCAFYSEAAFRVLEPAEFRTHLQAVRALFGKALGTRTGVFLGSASAMSLPQARLLEVLGEVNDTFGPRLRGVAAFQDPDHSPRRELSEYLALEQAGLRHVTLGLETGDPELRTRLGKSGDVDPLHHALTTQKAAGLRCAITVLLGAFGPDGTESHVQRTTEVLARLPLDDSDLVYLSPLSSQHDAELVTRERRLFYERLAPHTDAKLSPYRMDLFRYYA